MTAICQAGTGAITPFRSVENDDVRIGVDGFNLAMPHGTGIATYAAELVRTLKLLGHQVDGIFGIEVPHERALRAAVFFDRYRRTPPAAPRLRRWQRPAHAARQWTRAVMPAPVRAVPLDGSVTTTDEGTAMIPAFDRLFSIARLFDNAAYLFARTGRFTTVRLSDPPDIMHWTYPLPIRVAKSRNVYTLHDLVPLKLPYTTLDDKTLYGRLIEACLRQGDQICTVSEASRHDIVSQFGIAESGVTNTFQTSSLSPAILASDAAADAQAIESIFGLSKRGYFLYYGAIEPKKNVGRLIEAFLTLRTATPLVIVGGPAWQSEQELALLPGEGPSGALGTFYGPRGQTIIRLGYLAKPLLAKLVRSARAVLFPSLYEGFGLPVLEAMQLGTPVITSSTSSLPEIAGDAAILIDPYDVTSLVDAMRRVDQDETLLDVMAGRGLMQAQNFTVDRYQDRLTELYRAAMAAR